MADKNNMTLKEIFGNTKIYVSRVFNSPVGALIALGAGLVAQLLLENKKIFFALVLYFYAAICFVVSTQNVKLPEFHIAIAKIQKDNLRFKTGFIAGVLAVILAVLSFIQFDNNNPVLAPWMLYLLSMLLLVLSAYLLDGANKGGLTKNKNLISTEHIILFAILSLAFFLRIYKLDQIPFGLWYDEADNGLSALRLLNDPGYFPLFAETTNLPAHLYISQCIGNQAVWCFGLCFKICKCNFWGCNCWCWIFCWKTTFGTQICINICFSIEYIAVGY